MASEGGAPDDRVDPKPLVEAAARKSFFGLVALLERLYPSAARVGGSGPPAAESVRFRHDPTLTFAAGDVAAVKQREREGGWEVTTTFLGVTGASSPAPVHLAEEIAHEDDEHPLRRDFLDLFHHRLIGLLYRIVAKYDWSRDALTTVDDEWSRRALSLSGYDPLSNVKSLLPRWRLLRLAPVLATRARNARGLRLALEDVIGAELEGAAIEIEEFVGQWVVLEDRHKTRLGTLNTHLSMDLVLGNRVFDRTGAFRVKIGPCSQRVYDRLLPGGDLHKSVYDVVSVVVAEPLDCELDLTMADAPAFILQPPRARLGQNTWLAGASGVPRIRRVVQLRAA